MSDNSEILANPSDFGFEWSLEHVSTDGQGDKGTDLGEVPILVVTNVARFETAFPGRIMASLDGSSIRVISQRVVRSKREKNRSISAEDLKPLVLDAVLGIRAKAVRVDTLAAFAASQGLTVEELKALVAK